MSTQLTAMAARVGWACETFDLPIEALPGEVAADFECHERATAVAWASLIAEAGMHPWQRRVLERIQDGPDGKQVVVNLPRRNA